MTHASRCPGCKKSMRIPPGAEGKRIKCSKCETISSIVAQGSGVALRQYGDPATVDSAMISMGRRGTAAASGSQAPPRRRVMRRSAPSRRVGGGQTADTGSAAVSKGVFERHELRSHNLRINHGSVCLLWLAVILGVPTCVGVLALWIRGLGDSWLVPLAAANMALLVLPSFGLFVLSRYLPTVAFRAALAFVGFLALGVSVGTAGGWSFWVFLPGTFLVTWLLCWLLTLGLKSAVALDEQGDGANKDRRRVDQASALLLLWSWLELGGGVQFLMVAELDGLPLPMMAIALSLFTFLAPLGLFAWSRFRPALGFLVAFSLLALNELASAALLPGYWSWWLLLRLPVLGFFGWVLARGFASGRRLAADGAPDEEMSAVGA